MTRRRCRGSEDGIHSWRFMDEWNATEKILVEEGAVQVEEKAAVNHRRFYCIYCRDVVVDKNKLEEVNVRQ